MENNLLGERIRKLRMRLGYSQYQLAAHLGVSIQAISNWENGKSNPEISILVPLANLLNVGTDELLGNQKLRKDWEDRWQRAMKSGGHPNALHVAEEALQHLPGDRLFRFRRANEEYITAAITDDAENRKRLLASSVQHFSDLLKEYPDYEEAGIMFVQTLILILLGRYSNARRTQAMGIGGNGTDRVFSCKYPFRIPRDHSMLKRQLAGGNIIRKKRYICRMNRRRQCREREFGKTSNLYIRLLPLIPISLDPP